jgi:hypothetical protein
MINKIGTKYYCTVPVNIAEGKETYELYLEKDNRLYFNGNISGLGDINFSIDIDDFNSAINLGYFIELSKDELIIKDIIE